MAGKNVVEIVLSARDQASETVKKAFETVNDSHSKMSTMLKVGAGAAAGALGLLGGFIAKTGVDYDTMIENSTIAWTTLLGSQTKAKDMIQQISTFAKNTQFGTEQVDAMAKYFNNAGFAGKNLFDELQRIADVSGAFNISADAAQELARQMSQVSQAGVAYTSDLDVLQNQGVPIFRAIAKEVGTNVAAVRKMASNGQITADIYNKAFNSIANTVKGASDAQSKTFTGMISTLKDDFGIISGILAKPLFNVLHDGLTKLMPLLDSFTSLARGDFKSFASGVEQDLGKTAGGMVISFAQTLMQGFGLVSQYVNKGKLAFKALFDYLKGDDMGGLTILTKLGLSPDQVVAVDKVLMSIVGFIKGFASGLKTTFSSLFSGKNSFGSSFSEMFKTAKTIVLPIMSDIAKGIKTAISQLSSFWKTNGKQIIQSVKDTFKMVADFTNTVLVPSFKAVWATIKTVGVPMVKDLIATLKIFGNSSSAWIQNLGGIVAAIAAFKIINTVVGLYKAWKEATIIMTAVQAAFDVVLNANPIGIVALAIGGLVAAGIYMYQHWSSISAGMAGIWRSIEQGAASMVNGIVDKLNVLIQVMDKITGFKIPTIPKVSWGSSAGNGLTNGSGNASASSGARATMAHYASGTSFHPGGLAMVGENGPEIVNLPRGAGVTNTSKTQELPDLIASAVGNAMLMALSQLKPSNNQPIVLNIDGRAFARLLKPHMDAENKRVGTQIRLQTI